MNYFLIAGEASGDLQAAQLMRFIRFKDPDAEFRCVGGEQMQARGGRLLKHYRDLAFMGLFDVIAHLGTIFSAMRMVKKELTSNPPDILILVDYAGFNMRIARYAHKLNIRVFYFISPKIWAWNRSRVHAVKRFVERMFVILPFEVDFYASYGYKADYVGNPLVDKISEDLPSLPVKEEFIRKYNLDGRPVIAVLPGSRIQEVKRMLPLMVKMTTYFPAFQFIIAGTSSLPLSLYEKIIRGYDIRLIINDTYTILRHATAALVTSGTATLEAALFRVPEVVCYAVSRLTYLIGRPLVKVKYISLPNLIIDRPVVKELIQHHMNEKNMRAELENLLPPSAYRDTMLSEFDDLIDKMGNPGAAERVAGLMFDALRTAR